MAKRLKMNLKTGELVELGGTDSLPHPGNFPLGSVESRAAARAIVAAGRLRPGDKGSFKCGCTWLVARKIDSEGRELSSVVQIIFPKDFSRVLEEHAHDEVAG